MPKVTLSAELRQQSTFSDHKTADLSLERVAFQVLDAHLLHDILKDPTEICTQVLTAFLLELHLGGRTAQGEASEYRRLLIILPVLVFLLLPFSSSFNFFRSLTSPLSISQHFLKCFLKHFNIFLMFLLLLFQNLENSLHSIVGNLWIRGKKPSSSKYSISSSCKQATQIILHHKPQMRLSSQTTETEKELESAFDPSPDCGSCKVPGKTIDHQGLLGIWGRWII